MRVLVLNCGSSSVKFAVIDTQTKDSISSGLVENIGVNGHVKAKGPAGNIDFNFDCPTHAEAVAEVQKFLAEQKLIESIEAIGHRVVHGGKYIKSERVTQEVIDYIRSITLFAPLHEPAHATGMECATKFFPGLPQVAVFDTAFHQTMPERAYLYAIPYELYEQYGVRRYGFHGTSHRYVSQRVCDMLGVKAEEQRIITCHIGNGGSVAAVKYGKCIDTTMGLTPLEGLMMGTRCGDIDAGAVAFLQNQLHLDADGISNLLNKKSGVLGVTGISSDMRDVENAAGQGNHRAQLALDMYFYRIRKYVGAYAAAMGGVDIIVFTAGVGENQPGMREAVCKDMEWMGVKIDEALNAQIRGKECVISTPDSKVTVCIVPTDEELMIATDTMALCR